MAESEREELEMLGRDGDDGTNECEDRRITSTEYTEGESAEIATVPRGPDGTERRIEDGTKSEDIERKEGEHRGPNQCTEKKERGTERESTETEREST